MMVSMGAWRASQRGRSASFEGRRAATGAIVEDADGTENSSLPGGLRAPFCCPGTTPSDKAPAVVVLSKEAGRARERGHAAASGVLERPEAACGVLERACPTAALHHNSRRPAWQGALSLHRHLVARGWLARSRRQCIRGAAVSAQVHEGASSMGQRGAWQGGQALHHIAEERTTTRLGICSSP